MFPNCILIILISKDKHDPYIEDLTPSEGIFAYKLAQDMKFFHQGNKKGMAKYPPQVRKGQWWENNEVKTTDPNWSWIINKWTVDHPWIGGRQINIVLYHYLPDTLRDFSICTLVCSRLARAIEMLMMMDWNMIKNNDSPHRIQASNIGMFQLRLFGSVAANLNSHGLSTH